MIITYVGIFLWAMVKFLFAPFTALLAIPEITWIQNYILCVSAGLPSATIFYNSSVFFINRTQDRRARKGIVKNKFTRRNKIIIKTKNSIGLWGLALLTASFISIPLGSVITAKFYRHEKRTIYIIYLCIIVLGAVLTSISYLLKP